MIEYYFLTSETAPNNNQFSEIVNKQINKLKNEKRAKNAYGDNTKNEKLRGIPWLIKVILVRGQNFLLRPYEKFDCFLNNKFSLLKKTQNEEDYL